jgi:hypothetical protein
MRLVDGARTISLTSSSDAESQNTPQGPVVGLSKDAASCPPYVVGDNSTNAREKEASSSGGNPAGPPAVAHGPWLILRRGCQGSSSVQSGDFLSFDDALCDGNPTPSKSVPENTPGMTQTNARSNHSMSKKLKREGCILAVLRSHELQCSATGYSKHLAWREADACDTVAQTALAGATPWTNPSRISIPGVRTPRSRRYSRLHLVAAGAQKHPASVTPRTGQAGPGAHRLATLHLLCQGQSSASQTMPLGRLNDFHE